jgi:hypothetical protein
LLTHTFSRRQFSSPWNTGPEAPAITVGQASGVPVAFNGNVQGVGGCGGRHRLFPAVEAA